jgi:hypothetical protein
MTSSRTLTFLPRAASRATLRLDLPVFFAVSSTKDGEVPLFAFLPPPAFPGAPPCLISGCP